MDGISRRWRLRTLLVLIALAAVPLAVWKELRSPARQWRRTLRDDRAVMNSQLMREGVEGKVSGLSSDFAIAELIDALSDPRADVRQRAIYPLNTTLQSGEDAAPALARVAEHDPEERNRFEAVQVLGSTLSYSKSTRAIAVGRPALVAARSDPSELVRTAAAGALLRMGDETGLPILIEALRGVRRARSYAHAPTAFSLESLKLAGPHARPAIPALLEFLGDFSTPKIRMREEYRRIAAQILVGLGERDAAVRVMDKALEEGDSETRKAAAAIKASLDTPLPQYPMASGPAPVLKGPQELRAR